MIAIHSGVAQDPGERPTLEFAMKWTTSEITRPSTWKESLTVDRQHLRCGHCAAWGQSMASV